MKLAEHVILLVTCSLFFKAKPTSLGTDRRVRLSLLSWDERARDVLAVFVAVVAFVEKDGGAGEVVVGVERLDEVLDRLDLVGAGVDAASEDLFFSFCL